MPDTPTTPTGWADHDIAWDHTSDINDWAANHEALREGCQGCAKIARIEAEARDALTAAPLDLARLREALDLCGIGFIDGHLASTWADAIAAEYQRFAEEPHDA